MPRENSQFPNIAGLDQEVQTIALCSYFSVSSTLRSDRLKIVVSPVRVRISPSSKGLQNQDFCEAVLGAPDRAKRSRLPFPALSAQISGAPDVPGGTQLR
jgi:hypothetical protein